MSNSWTFEGTPLPKCRTSRPPTDGEVSPQTTHTSNDLEEVLFNILNRRSTTKISQSVSIADLPKCTLQDALGQVSMAWTYHESEHSSTEILSAVAALSQRIHHYATAVDLFIIHCSQHANMAFHTINTIITSTYAGGRSALVLLNALCQIADALPKVELGQAFHSMTVQKNVLEQLYILMLEFFVRALRWHGEGKAASMEETQAPLQYDDLLTKMRFASGIIQMYAWASVRSDLMTISGYSDNAHKSHAITCNTGASTLRNSGHIYGVINISGPANVQLGDSIYQNQDISTQISRLTSAFQQLRDDVTRSQALNLNTHLEPSDMLTRNGRVELLADISKQCSIDHQSMLQASLRLCKLRKQCWHRESALFWRSSKMQAWSQSDSNASLFIKGCFKDRHVIREFCAGVIQKAESSAIPMLYILCSHRYKSFTLLDVLRSLILQCLSLKYFATTPKLLYYLKDKSMEAVSCEEDCTAFLTEIFQHLRVVFVVVNAEVMEPEVALECRLALRGVIDRLETRNAETRIRILVTSQSPRQPFNLAVDGEMLRIGGFHTATAQRPSDYQGLGARRQKRPEDGVDLLACMRRPQKRLRIR